MKKHVLKRLLSLMLVVALCAGFAIPAGAAGTTGGNKVTFEKVDNDAVSVAPVEKQKVEETEDPAPYADTETVRVSIVLEDKSTIEKVGTTENIAASATATAYRAKLEQTQASVSAKISSTIGEKLDVVWNLTLAANIISANVEYGQIAAIEKVPGVKEVLIETRYEPMVVDTNEANDPNMATSGKQIGSAVAWESGYTGAGSRIAIIDTGVDSDHQSFDSGAFNYSLQCLAEVAGKTLDDYKAELNLLDADAVKAVVDQLNVAIDPAKTFVSDKIPFAYNYVDRNYDITHDNDTQGEHGSHVTGIAAANAFIPNDDGTYANALDTVKVQGVAPDAQIITMKVFGTKGGAYDSDYMVAIEDAIVLGADSVNLSLGSGNPGMSRNSNEEYQAILDNLTKCGTVVAMSAGNSGSWVENASNAGYLYADDVSMQTNGSPGSFTNSLAVASVDNDGATGVSFSVAGNSVVYNETSYKNAPLSTLAGEKEYIFIDGMGTEEDWAAVGDALKGKVAFCSRGTISFYQKAEFAATAGAIATVIYNNAAGTINMDLSDYTKTAPVVSITQADGAMVKAKSTAVTDDAGNVLYYTGTMTITGGVSSSQYNSEYYTMSDFSSWGVPGSLELKPEITAPGGNIYSVWGSNKDNPTTPFNATDKYENMSGTSMASPQVAGMAALVAQYIRENDLTTKTGLSARQLTQSLLMSTAVPMLEEESGSYYPVLRQGAGLANVGAAVSADSYILMGADATASYADGKVKAELGDDPKRTGTYTFSFSINNLTGEAKTYTLDADFFTQDLFEYYANGNQSMSELAYYMDTLTVQLDTAVTFSTGNKVTVAANDKADVTVTVELGDEWDEYLAVAENGLYVEGYVFVTSAGSEDGAQGTEHSIPVLGFYGNWSDASMYDVGSYAEYAAGDEYRIPYLGKADANSYLITYADEPNASYYFGGNPLVPDDTYMPERNAINSENGDSISKVKFTAIRNAAASAYTAVNVTAGKICDSAEPGSVSSAYYYVNGSKWMNTSYTLNTKFVPAGAAEGDQLSLSLALAPEYYVDAEGKVDWVALGKGAYFTVPMVVDNTAPELKDVSISLLDSKMTVTASDNQYVAAVALYNKAGTSVYTYTGAKQKIQPGETAEYTLDLSEVNGKKFLLQVFDYAMNAATYVIEMQIGEEVPLPEMIAFDLDNNYWTSFNQSTTYKELAAYSNTSHTFFAATIVDHIVFASTDEGDLYVMPEDDLTEETFVANMGAVLTDMAYNKADGKIYGVTDGDLVTVDKLTGELGVVGEIGVLTNTLACDANGTFYCNEYGTGNVYKFTLASLMEAEAQKIYDFNADGAVTEADGQTLLDYATGKISAIPANGENADFDGDADIDSYDAYLFFQKLSSGELGSTGVELLVATNLRQSQYVQAMEINPNTGMLCWNSYYAGSFLGMTFGYSYYYEIDTATGEYTRYNDLWDELSCLIIPERTSGGGWTTPTDEVSGVQLSATSLSILRGSTEQLTASVLPWTATDRTVTWSTSDPSVATVNEKGVVTGVSAGTCTVTATSNLDPTVSASCEVTVEVLQITMKGALQDDKGVLQLFDWNFETDETWTGGQQFTVNIISATSTGKGTAYATNSDGTAVISMNLADGTTETVGSAPVPLADMAMSEFSTEMQDLLDCVYYYYYLPAKDPANIDTSAFGFSSYLSTYTGGSEFVGIATDGTTEYTTSDGETVNAEVVYLLDDAGYLWVLKVYPTAEGYSCGINFVPTNLTEAGYEMVYDEDDNPLSSLCVGEDGNLYFSAYNGDTNVLYRLSYDEILDGFDAKVIGDVGTDVWPAILFEVTSNASSEGNARHALEAASTVTVASQNITAEEMLAAGSARKGAGLSMSASKLVDNTQKSANAATGAQTPSVMPLSSSVVGEGEDTVTVSVTAKAATGGDVASTNGVATVNWNTEALTLTGITVNGDYQSINRANEATGEITFGYVSLTGIAVGDPVAELVFAVKSTTAADSITITHEEANDAASGYVEELALSYEHENTELVGAKDATCTEDGYTGDLYCTDCGALLVKGEVIPATGHTPELRNQKDATFTEEGYTGDLYCAVCDVLLEKGEIIPVKELPAILPPVTVPTLPGTGDDLPFVDVGTGDWFYGDVEYVYEEGLMNGTSGTRFDPNGVLTRAMVVTILYRMEVEPEAVRTFNTFSDVSRSDWYGEAVEWAAANGIVNGYSDGRFGPNDPITREQLAAILYRYASFKGFDVSKADTTSLAGYPDAAKVSGYAVPAVQWAVGKGLINGVSGKLAPQNTATRAQVAAIIHRFLEG